MISTPQVDETVTTFQVSELSYPYFPVSLFSFLRTIVVILGAFQTLILVWNRWDASKPLVHILPLSSLAARITTLKETLWGRLLTWCLFQCTGFSNNGLNNHQQRFPADNNGGGGGSYGNRMSFSRPDSYIDNYSTPPNQYQSNQGRSARLSQRMNSEAGVYGRNNQAVYPSHAHQQSYDTVTSASGTGSHGTDQWGTSTDPSSENSSIDKIQQVPKADLGEEYGFSGFGGAPQFRGPILEEHGLDAPAYGQPGYGQPQMSLSNGHPYQGNSGRPPPPPQKETAYRVPIKLGNSSGPSGEPTYVQPQPLEKRKSWLKRRFSKG